jgi:hypothetical protein
MRFNPRFTVAAATVAVLSASAASAQTFDLSWYTIDGGGGTSTGSGFTLSGTIGQPDAGAMTGGGFTLRGGFWPGASDAPCPGARADADCDGLVNFFDIDPFVMALFDLPAYQASFCDGQICAVDIDCSGLVNFFDIDPFVTCIFGACDPCP